MNQEDVLKYLETLFLMMTYIRNSPKIKKSPLLRPQEENLITHPLWLHLYSAKLNLRAKKWMFLATSQEIMRATSLVSLATLLCIAQKDNPPKCLRMEWDL